jgi:hypothetical protein
MTNHNPRFLAPPEQGATPCCFAATVQAGIRQNRCPFLASFEAAAAVAGANVWIAVPLLMLAVFLFAWGLEPKRTEEFIGRLPCSPAGS